MGIGDGDWGLGIGDWGWGLGIGDWEVLFSISGLIYLSVPTNVNLTNSSGLNALYEQETEKSVNFTFR